MILTQYYLQCLSQGSYLIADESSHQAIVVDPRRDISEYLNEAADRNLTIVGVINTHFHADFVAGHLELAEATGAWIGYGQRAEAEYEFHGLAHGQHISLGEVDIEVLETPGHTWESISLVVREHAEDAPYAVLTGDALFIGDVGRPDLAVAVGASADELARAMYRSIHEVLLRLPDDTLLYPAHGAGSACGKNISDELHSTIGMQRMTNLSVRTMNEDAFVEMITTGQPAAPEYFAVDAVLNRQDRELLSRDRELSPRSAEQARADMAVGVRVIDTRSPEEFARRQLIGSVNVGVDGRFAETAGMVVDQQDRILVVANSGREAEAGMRLARIGFDQVVGYLDGPDAALDELADLTGSSRRLSVDEFERMREDEQTAVVDVRNPGEREEGAIPGSLHIPLAELVRREAEVPGGKTVVVHCAGGWRSSVGASALRSLGHTDVTDLLGGYNGWQEHPQPAFA